MAVLEADFQAMKQKRRRISRRDDEGGLDSVLEKVEEVVLAAQGLSEVTTAIQELTRSIRRFMEDPVFAACCESLVGCRSCATLWLQKSSVCLKCRADDFSTNIH